MALLEGAARRAAVAAAATAAHTAGVAALPAAHTAHTAPVGVEVELPRIAVAQVPGLARKRRRLAEVGAAEAAAQLRMAAGHRTRQYLDRRRLLHGCDQYAARVVRPDTLMDIAQEDEL